MNIERLMQIAKGVATRAELEQLKANVIQKGNIEAAQLVNEILLERFPVKAKSGGGATPTEAAFLGRVKSFENGKEAYIWLIEQFQAHVPNAIPEYLRLQARSRSRARGSRFAKSPAELFPPGSARADKVSHYSGLSGGWFADVNIDHKDKFATLLKLSHACSLSYPAEAPRVLRRPVGLSQTVAA